MADQQVFLTGVVEGFYGRSWSHPERLAYAAYLPKLGLNSYLYCPKNDPYLRKQWAEEWPQNTFIEMRELAEAYGKRQLLWGVGLSPYALYQSYGAAERAALKTKVEYLTTLNMPLLAILFDDMPGAIDDLAARQAEIVTDVCHWAGGSRVLVCPTYYSFDPVLEKHFGAMPQRYWGQLGAELPEGVDVFWTGNKVCADAITCEDIDSIVAELGRPVILWDNYPVNDGALRSRHLYTSALADRERQPAASLTGHLCNPMNQPLLSLLALAGLGELYNGEPVDCDWLAKVLGVEAYQQLLMDGPELQQLGLAGIDDVRKQQLLDKYSTLPGSAAAEVAAWLRGEYTFDPACLTD
ncbi:MAG: beta-N-acetylglucosaminidase domain-containing protein [Halioglobus sp.]